MHVGDLIAPALLGLLGTGHCLGMCGPLVFAFPARTGRMRDHWLYHTGRIATYTAIGAILGVVGGGAILSGVARLEVGISLLVGLFLMGFGLLRMGIVPEPGWLTPVLPGSLPGIGRVLRSAAGGRGGMAMLLVGMVMGLLPCGLSYGAFSLALAAGGPTAGALRVLAFGVGTLPGLMALGTGAGRFLKRYRQPSDILAGLMMVGMALSLLADALPALLGG